VAIAYVGLGSNLGDREAMLRAALARLERTGAARVLAVSSFRETDPVGGPPQPRYVNAVARRATAHAPRARLEALLATEAALGRVRGERWGPRVVDLDLLLYDELALDEPGLEVPHPRILEREFVTGPLGEIAPDVLDALRRRAM
jgi:2-amino-4-hydroxy-6-hydroxymethyldihydropteridine diphosphokinase